MTTEAKPADHRFCPVLEAVAYRVSKGREDWGYRHDIPGALTEAAAKEAKAGLCRARNHSSLKRNPCGPEPLSVRADYVANGDGTYHVWFQVWPRRLAKAEIARRVKAGESLAYNVQRGKV